MKFLSKASKLQFLAVFLLAVALPACSTIETQSFNVQKNSAVESAKIATDADFGRYSSVLAEDMGVFFATNSPSTEEDLQRLRQIFRNAFIAELKDYNIVTEPGPSTMAVQASLVDLRNSVDASVPGVRREIRDIAVPGSLVFMMEMKDSQSGRVLARAADSASAPTFATAGGTETDWNSVQQAAENWAALFRKFLDENLSN